jgi:hypothetical protein
MIFKTYNTEKVARILFNGYLFGSMSLSVVALCGFFSGAGTLSTLSGFVFLVFVSLLSLNKLFRRSPFAIPFCYFTFLYLNIPAAFILFEGSDYIFGSGLEMVPFPQSAYQQSLPWGFMYLFLCWVAVWLGIITIQIKRRIINTTHFSSIKLTPILLIGVIVFIVSWISIQNITLIRLRVPGVEQVNSLVSVIFFDNAYLLMAGVLLFFKLNEPKYIVKSDKINKIVFLIFLGFSVLQFIAGSKAAVLSRLLTFVLLPFCFTREYYRTWVSFPAPKYIVLFALIALPLYYIVLIQRISVANRVVPDLIILLENILKVDMNVVNDIISQVFYRFSWGGIDRFFLVFQSFIFNTLDPGMTIEFVIYLAKNTLNLLLPGTPFPESYVMSSQLFPQVIQGITMNGNMELNELILSLNTQPYTIFGVFIIIFGITAPVFLYLITSGFIFIYSKLKSIFLKIAMIAFFAAALESYGFEISIGYSANVFVSILFIYFLIKILSRFYIKSSNHSLITT